MKLNPGIDLSQFFKFTTRERSDLVTPISLVCLSLFGVFFIYSAQYANNGQQWINQIVYLAMGAVIYGGTSLMDYRIWLRYAHFPYLAALGMLVLVLIPGIGTTHGMGARRWIDLGLAFQPSEFAKISVLIATASVLTGSRLGTVRDSFQTLLKLALAVGLPMLLIVLEPDLGSALAIAPMVFAMMFVSNLSLRFFAGALGAFVLLIGVVAVDVWRYSSYIEANHLSYARDMGSYEKHTLLRLPLKDYMRNRLLTFALPDKVDPMGIGWNSRQSLISVGSGGLTGKGWTEGTQASLGYLPKNVAHSDFIFSVIAEEKGFLGSITVIGLFGVVLWNGLRIAGLARDRFGALLALGVTVLFTVHVFVNIAMTIGLVPVKGIPLPFISYGGTFVLSCCLLQGLVQSVYRFRRDF